MIQVRKLYGFTLLELIIVLALLAILASVAVAKFVDLSQKAFEVQEKTTIAALRSGVILFQAKYCLQGNCRWYGDSTGVVLGENGDNLFRDLLDNPPLNISASPPNPGPGDGVNWCIARSDDHFYIWCPHAGWFTSSNRNSNMWRYYYSGPKAGRIIHDLDDGVGVTWGYERHK